MDTRLFNRSELGSVSSAVIVSSSVFHGDKKACQLEYSSSLRSKKTTKKKTGYEPVQKTWMYTLNNNVDHEFNRLLDLHVYFADMHQ